MKNTFDILRQKLDALQEEFSKEYARLAQKYGFILAGRRVIFLEEWRKRNESFAIPAWKYAISTSFAHFLSIPFIYGMVIPAILLDIFLYIYQQTAFRLYKIPLVKRSEYIIFDRRFLGYLNFIQKINCLYCSYMNGLFAYSVEVGARTERYWCPLKAASRPKSTHSWYYDFADYGNPEEWKEKF
jgi:hypothetical protein